MRAEHRPRPRRGTALGPRGTHSCGRSASWASSARWSAAGGRRRSSSSRSGCPAPPRWRSTGRPGGSRAPARPARCAPALGGSAGPLSGTPRLRLLPRRPQPRPVRLCPPVRSHCGSGGRASEHKGREPPGHASQHPETSVQSTGGGVRPARPRPPAPRPEHAPHPDAGLVSAFISLGYLF